LKNNNILSENAVSGLMLISPDISSTTLHRLVSNASSACWQCGQLMTLLTIRSNEQKREIFWKP